MHAFGMESTALLWHNVSSLGNGHSFFLLISPCMHHVMPWLGRCMQ
jgi:hypothetical protein